MANDLAARRAAAEHGTRAAQYLRTIARAGRIAAAQGAPCLPQREMDYLAAHHAAEAKP